ncbi:hypothetical protein HDV06_002301 [Boothiomyces sp. JEL0866]|nr:hypothetical protein HDV06_002301 [Boothiomyces sp. JEL0866]
MNIQRQQQQFKSLISKEYQQHKEKVNSISWCCKGLKVASGSSDKTIRILNYEKNDYKVQDEFKGHSDAVERVEWHPDHPEKLGSVSLDKYLRLWDIKSSKPTLQVKTDGELINMCWSPDGRNIAVGDEENTLYFIDLRGGTEKGKSYIFKTIKNDYDILNQISWNYAGDLFHVTTGTGCVEILEFPSFQPAYNLEAHSSSCTTIAFDPRGRYFCTGGADAVAILWDLEYLLAIQTFSRSDTPIRSISFSHDGELLALSSEDSKIEIVHAESGELIHTIKTNASVPCVAWNPSKQLLAYSANESGRNAGIINIFGHQPPEQR